MLCDHTTDMNSQSLNINPHNVSPNRTLSPLHTSDHCVENRSGSCSEVENTSISANSTTSNSTNIILATSFHNRARLTLTNSSHCIENRAGSHLENEVTATSKTTPVKATRKSLRQLTMRDENNYIEHVKEYKRKTNYIKALRALSKSRNENPAYKEANIKTHLSMI